MWAIGGAARGEPPALRAAVRGEKVAPSEAGRGHAGGAAPLGCAKRISHYVPLLVLAFLVGQAANVRITRYRSLPAGSLESDVGEFLDRAATNRTPFAAGHKEPLYSFITKLFAVPMGYRPEAMRVQTICYSVAVVLGVFLLARAAFNGVVAAVAGFLVADDLVLVRIAMRGFRMEVFTLLIMLYCYCLFVRRWRTERRRLAAAGIAGGLACLLRMPSLSFIVPALALYVLERRFGWLSFWPAMGQGVGPRPHAERGEEASDAQEAARGDPPDDEGRDAPDPECVRSPSRLWRPLLGAATCLAITLAVVSPYLVNCAIDLGDPLVWINVQARWWADKETEYLEKHRVGSEAVARAVHQGERFNIVTYLVTKRRGPEMLRRSWQGYGRMLLFVTRHRRLVWALMPFGILGAAALLCTRHRWVVIVPLASMFPISFVTTLGASGRLYMQVFPFYAMCVGFGAWLPVWAAVAWIRRRGR